MKNCIPVRLNTFYIGLLCVSLQLFRKANTLWGLLIMAELPNKYVLIFLVANTMLKSPFSVNFVSSSLLSNLSNSKCYDLFFDLAWKFSFSYKTQPFNLITNIYRFFIFLNLFHLHNSTFPGLLQPCTKIVYLVPALTILFTTLWPYWVPMLTNYTSHPKPACYCI